MTIEMPSARPTWDVTYRAQPLSERAYRAHLALLRGYRARKAPEFPRDVTERDIHEAKVAIGPLIYCGACESRARVGPDNPAEPFHWCDYKLTTYGELYASQRGL
jgi:hypothetical protein